jgi:hypothetical protein
MEAPDPLALFFLQAVVATTTGLCHPIQNKRLANAHFATPLFCYQ